MAPSVKSDQSSGPGTESCPVGPPPAGPAGIPGSACSDHDGTLNKPQGGGNIRNLRKFLANELELRTLCLRRKW